MVSADTVARILGVSKSTVTRLSAAGKFGIPSVEVGERIRRYRRPDVEAFFGAPLEELAPWLVVSDDLEESA